MKILKIDKQNPLFLFIWILSIFFLGIWCGSYQVIDYPISYLILSVIGFFILFLNI